MAASTSQRQVFGTTELLQNILLNLDLQTLLVSAPLVARRWRDLISYSTPIQRALYFRGMPAPSYQEEDNNDNTDDDYGSWPCDRFAMNPLLQAKFDPFFYDAELVAKETGKRPRRQSCLLTSDRFKDLPLAGSEAWREAFMRPGASWRQMLVTQPPVRRLGFCESGRNMGDVTFRFSELRPASNDDEEEDDGDGLRMGELYDAVVSWLGTPHPAFTIMWNPSEYVWPKFQYEDVQDFLDSEDVQNFLGSEDEGGVPVAEPCRVIDLLIILRSTIPRCVMLRGEVRRQEECRKNEWKAKFAAYSEPCGEPPAQAAELTKWKTCGLDGCEAELEFGEVVYW
ncbi:F-box domain-containing protein [Apiospora arundinis]|uniref:F-box domain-containing protein n=1 Tax=Apiospora arundinis TaxID=335852 RepID=A0ABR2IS00_9PEZI